MTKKKEVIQYNTDLESNLQIIQSVKEEVDKVGNNCLQIKVVDESTLSVAQQNLATANQLVKSIEEKRKAIKQPFLDAGRKIDAISNEIIAIAEKGVEHLKNEIKQWEIKRLEEVKKAQEELERKQKEEAEKRAAEERERKEIREYLDTKAIPSLQNLYETATTPEQCDKNIGYIESNFPPATRFGIYADEAMSQKNNYIQLLKNKKQQFESADKLSDAEKELLKQKEEVAKWKAKIAQEEAAIRAKEEEIRLEAERKAAEEAAELERQKLLQEQELNKTRNIRYIWKFELVDKSKLSEDWTTMDEEKVKEYLKANKDSLKDGEIINGVKFYQDQSVRA